MSATGTSVDGIIISIGADSGTAAVNIDALARSLESLKTNSKLTKVSNNLTKLSTSLTTLKTALSGMPSLNPLQDIMSGLSGIQKLSGLNSALNTLKKLPEITKSLDAAQITEFGSRMEKLANALDPLATKINQVSAGFAKLPSQVSKTVTATNKMATSSEKAAKSQGKLGDSLDNTHINLAAIISNLQSYYHAIMQVARAIGTTVAQAIEWDGVQARFGRAFGEYAEETLSHIDRISDALKINKQEFMQYSSLFNEMLTGYGINRADASKMAVGYTELAYDIWAAFNDVYKTLDGEEGAIAAVRSAISGEVEPIRRAGFTIVDSQLAVTAAMYGVEYSTQSATEAQKSYLRYLTMVNQAADRGIIGVYASEMQTAEGAVRTLTQQIKGLVQSIGSLFIPILVKVVPWISAFVELLTDAVSVIAEFFGIQLFEIDWGRSDGLQGVTEGASDAQKELEKANEEAKKLKDYTMGFDELNIINPDSGGSGSSGGSGGSGAGWENLDVESLWDESVFAQATKQVDELKQKIKDWFEDWKKQIAIVGAALASLSIANLLEQMGDALGFDTKFGKVLENVKKLASVAIILTIQYSLMSEYLENFIKTGEWENYVWAAIVGALGAFGSYLAWGKKGLVLSLAVTALVSLKSTFEDGSVDSSEEVVTGLTGVASGAVALGIAWPKLKVVFEGIKEFFEAAKQMAPEVGWLAALFPKMSGAFAPISGAVSSAAKGVGAFLGGISAPAWAAIAAAIAAVGSVVVFLKRNWEELGDAIKNFFKNNIVPKLESIKESWEKMKSAIADTIPSGVIQWFKDAAEWIGNVVKSIGDWFKSIDWLDTIATVFEWLGAFVFAQVSGPIAAAFSSIVQFIQGLVKWFSGLIQIVTGFVDFWVALFTGESLIDPLKKMWAGIKDVFTGMYDMTIGVVVNWVKSIIDWFTELWDVLVGHSIVPDMIEAIIDWFLSLPGKILSPIKTFVDDVIKTFKNMWSNIKSWWNTNVAPKFTLNYWKEVFGRVGSAASSKLGEIKGTISGVWNGIKSWWNTNVAPKLTLNYWKTKFDSIVSAISTKLDEAWAKVKNFFSASEWKKKIDGAIQAIKDNFKMPSFPKIKLGVTYDTNVGAVKKAIYEALGLDGWPNLSWTTYAHGGFPSTGQMFIAREAGPELVGNINGRTAVANNDQIVAAVSQGVYSAVVAAMSAGGQGGEQAINIYLDGKQITAAVEKRQKERGATLMTGGMAYGY